MKSSPPCPEVPGLDENMEVPESAGGEEDELNESTDIDIDLRIDPRHTHNLLLMKKKEHEGPINT